MLVDSVKHLPSAGEFFCLLERLYVFISTTKAHAVFMQKQKDLHPDKQPMQLQRLSDTRWTARHSAVNAVCCTYDSILATLKDIGCDVSDHSKAIDARGLDHEVRSFKFLLSLIIFDTILSCTKHLSDQLQSSHIDLASAAELVTGTNLTLQEYRSDGMWSKMYTYAKSVADLHNIEILPTTPASRPVRQRRPPQHLDDSAVFESTGSRELAMHSEAFKIDFYFPILDNFIAELGRRFDEKNLSIMSAIQACHPESSNFMTPHALQPLVSAYGLSINEIESEAKVAKRVLEKKDLGNINDVFLVLLPHKETFPNIFKLVRIALTIAVSTAQCERSFSTLKLVKTYLHSTMGESRLADLAILSIEREISEALCIDDAINDFAGLDKNRQIALS